MNSMNSLAILFGVLLGNVICEESEKKCLDIYKRFSDNHTACLPPNEDCDIVKSGVSEGDRKLILDEHNIRRNKLAIGGEAEKFGFNASSNMMELEWDDELATIAQSHASQCVFEHDCNTCRQSRDFRVGQNLYWYSSTSKNPQSKWKLAVKSWYDEIELIEGTTGTGIVDSFILDPEIAHFTQIAWAKTWKIGCGIVMYKSKEVPNSIEELYTCNYGPAGNTFFEKIYKQGEACGECPSNTCCGETCKTKKIETKYKALCKALTKRGPRSKSAGLENALFYCDFDSLDAKSKECASSVKGEKWQTIERPAGSYKSVVLNGSEETKMTFTKTFKPSRRHCCIQIRYRKGPNVAGTNGTNELQLFLQSVDQPRRKLQIGGFSDSEDWFTYNFGLQQWTEETQVVVQFNVPSDSSSQYLDIAHILVMRGKCPRSTFG